MQLQITAIDFDFSSESADPTWGDVDSDYQKEVTEEAIGHIWTVGSEEDLIEEVTCAYGWCVNWIDYRHVLV